MTKYLAWAKLYHFKKILFFWCLIFCDVPVLLFSRRSFRSCHHSHTQAHFVVFSGPEVHGEHIHVKGVLNRANFRTWNCVRKQRRRFSLLTKRTAAKTNTPGSFSNVFSKHSVLLSARSGNFVVQAIWLVDLFRHSGRICMKAWWAY